MNTSPGMEWRFLIIEDNRDIARELEEACPTFVQEHDKAVADVCVDFQDAADRLDSQRYDILIIDLKDDKGSTVEDEKLPGREIYEAVKKLRFVPVVFYTALPRHVLPEETTFVRVVEKTRGITVLADEIKGIFATGLPSITRIIDETQREYMWDFVQRLWKEFKSSHEQGDLAYLLARRLALTLENKARRLVRPIAGQHVKMADPTKAHPMQLYIYPPLGGNHSTGEILKQKVAEGDVYWVLLTPSCDFERKDRIDRALLAQCTLLKTQQEYLAWSSNPEDSDHLTALITDSRKNAQSERYKYLPGTFFLPDLVADFQQLKAVSKDELNSYSVVASLDSPYAESLLSSFSKYFGRLGTVDIDKSVVLDRLKAGLGKPADASTSSSETVASPPPATVEPATAAPSSPVAAGSSAGPPPPSHRAEPAAVPPPPAGTENKPKSSA
jgi:hypothetical protein